MVECLKVRKQLSFRKAMIQPITADKTPNLHLKRQFIII